MAHGGLQIQMEKTKSALESLDIEVEFLRFWDEDQNGDIIHFFGRPTAAYVSLAQGKGIRVVQSDLLGGLGARPAWVRLLQSAFIRSLGAALPRWITMRLAWDSFQRSDVCVALTEWERRLIIKTFGAPADRTVCVPNGVDSEFLTEEPTERGEWLVCVASIVQQKRILELCRAAASARTPLWIIGRPFSAADPYARRFLDFARQNDDIIRYQGAIDDRSQLAGILRSARGFVLASDFESLSLAALEAAACGAPLLLRDLPWARGAFGDSASYCSRNLTIAGLEDSLLRFHRQAASAPRPPRPLSWRQVAEKLVAVYRSALDRPGQPPPPSNTS